MNRRPPGTAKEQALRVLTHVIGSGSIRPLLLTLCLLVSLGWFTDSLFEWLADLGDFLNDGKAPSAGWLPLQRVVGVVVFPMLLIWLLLQAKKARERLRPRIVEDDNPPQACGLILFLSVLNDQKAKEIEEALALIDGMEGFRERFGDTPWRMPLEAIHHHRGRLRVLGLIPSSAIRERPGSIGQLPLFQRLLDRLSLDIELVTPGHRDTRFSRGLDFERDVEHLSEATELLYRHFRSEKGLSAADILIDVTGGQKPTSVAGAAVALAEGRRVQYVSTVDYRPRLYDVSYEG